MREQGMAHTGVGMQPCRAACGVEVVLVLGSNIVTVKYGVYNAVRRVCGYSHYAAEVGNQHGIRMQPTTILA